MKQLTIGDAVEVKAIAHFYYDENTRVCKAFNTAPFIGYIVGQQAKRLGEYVRGSARSRFGWDEDYDPPSLSVTGTITLWQVKTGLRNKILLVRDEDLEPCLAKAPVPLHGIRPKQ